MSKHGNGYGDELQCSDSCLVKVETVHLDVPTVNAETGAY